MLYINVRHSLPQVGARSQQPKLLEAGFEPARMHRTLKLARAQVHPEGLSLDINSYPSRHAYGFSTMNDFCREHRDRSLQDIVSSTSSHTQAAWDQIDNAAKPEKRIGLYFPSRAKSRLGQEVMKQRHIEVQAIPDPQIHATPYHIAGQNDVGDDHYTIDTTATAHIESQPGKCELYTRDAGYIRMWTTEGGYDTRV